MFAFFILLFGPMIRTIIKYNKIVYNLSIDFCFEICYNNNAIGNKPIEKQNKC